MIWDVEKNITEKIQKIVEKAQDFRPCLDRLTMIMDLTACHANGCELDLDAMLEADEAELLHDIFGINSNICHETGELLDDFLPRYKKQEFTDA